jgi:hypothetical protein
MLNLNQANPPTVVSFSNGPGNDHTENDGIALRGAMQTAVFMMNVCVEEFGRRGTAVTDLRPVAGELLREFGQYLARKSHD